ncbi:hypothetical protein Cni_G16088 [Canna indica]|uniref:F-box/LRR-repeat protein 15-like leucin rich repeat domain-containing protein n=1 Tax=Canna indica TaxID=4628 RepID=A0AAQ3QFK7_9LILI|nr:hypothetical protein Cni_G16088 [Canna indica]
MAFSSKLQASTTSSSADALRSLGVLDRQPPLRVLDQLHDQGISLDLRDCRNLGDEAVKALCYLPKLQVLLLDGTDTSNLGLSYLGHGNCPLVSLSLRGCKRITANDISSLFGGSVNLSLQVLDLSRLPNLTDDGILLLAKSRTPIIELRIRECPDIGDTSVMALASMQIEGRSPGSSLYVLDMYECGGITPLSFRWFKKPYFPRLR